MVRNASWLRCHEQLIGNPDDRRHGTHLGYYYGCRCDICCTANHEYNARKWAEKKAARDEQLARVRAGLEAAKPVPPEPPAPPKPNPVRVEKQAKAKAQRDAKRRKPTVLNELDANNMRGCSVRYDPPRCAVCGRYGRVEEHHVVKRSHGGKEGPTIMLCGFGNNLKDADGRYLCHGRAEQHMLHFRWHAADPREGEWDADGGFFGEGWWEYLETKVPMKYGNALLLGGWKRLGGA